MDLCRVGIALNYWTEFCFIASPAVAVSVPGYVCYTSELLPLVCFIFLLVLTFLFCVFFCLFEKCGNSIFAILLTGRELPSELSGAQPCLSTKEFMHLFLCASEGLTT